MAQANRYIKYINIFKNIKDFIFSLENRSYMIQEWILGGIVSWYRYRPDLMTAYNRLTIGDVENRIGVWDTYEIKSRGVHACMLSHFNCVWLCNSLDFIPPDSSAPRSRGIFAR